jgi:hypothetical protein
MGIDFSDAEQEAALSGVNTNLANFERLRSFQIPPETEPPLTFRPYLPGRSREPGPRPTPKSRSRLPAPPASEAYRIEDLAFLPVTTLSTLVRKRESRSTEAHADVSRAPEEHGPRSIASSRSPRRSHWSRRTGRQGDQSGALSGPTARHPMGRKGSVRDQRDPHDVGGGALPEPGVRLRRDRWSSDCATPGAVLVAKLSLGALGAGRQLVPRPDQESMERPRSSGSSPGQLRDGRGLVGFLSAPRPAARSFHPSAVNGVVGLRPTYRRVSRSARWP